VVSRQLHHQRQDNPAPSAGGVSTEKQRLDDISVFGQVSDQARHLRTTDDKQLGARDYVSFLTKGHALGPRAAAAHDRNVVARVCACYQAQDLEWIGRVTENDRKYIHAISGSGVVQLAGLKPLQILLKAGMDPIQIINSLESGATFNIIVWHAPPEDIRARRFNWKDIQNIIKEEYAHTELWESCIAEHWNAVETTPFYIHEMQYDQMRGLGAMRNGNRGRRVEREQGMLEVALTTKLQAIVRGNKARQQTKQLLREQRQARMNSGAAKISGQHDMVAILAALKTGPADRSEQQISRLLPWIKQVPFFNANVKTRTAMLQICSKIRHREYTPGSVLVQQGDLGDEFFAIVKGSVRIWVSDKLVGMKVSCQCFGDLALMEPDPSESSLSYHSKQRSFVF